MRSDIYIYMVTPHDPPTCCLYCDLQYNMLIFYVHILRLFVLFHTYIFIQTKTQQYSDTLWGGSLAENKKIIEPTKNTWRLFGEGPLEKTKTKKNQKIQRNQTHWRSCNPHGSVFLVFCFGGAEHIYIYIYHPWMI